MPLLILPPRRTPDAEAISAAAIDAGWAVEQLTSWRPPAWLRGHELVLYGEPLFADVISPALGLALLEPPVDWLAHLPPSYRRREVSVMTLGQAKGFRERAFIKPAAEKSFPAGVYAAGTSLPEGVRALPDATLVLVSEPIQWAVEFRCFVLDRTVTALSPYLRHGVLARAQDGTWTTSADEMAEARAYATILLADPAVEIPPAVVIDIGKIAGRGWAVVEANAAWGSGLYGCDPKHVLPVLARASRSKERVTNQDQPWVREHFVVEMG